MAEEIKKLHLGCGKNILEGWINLDKKAREGVDIVADLDNCHQVALPFEENSISEFFGRHSLEHIHNLLPLMQELYRIATPNATAIFHMPYGASDNAWEDPLNVRAFFINSFGFFSQPFYWLNDYGYQGDWQPDQLILRVNKKKYEGVDAKEIFDDVLEKRNVVSQMTAVLRAIKPIRETKAELQVPPKIEFLLDDTQS